MFVKSKMERNPVTISSDASFYDARKLIREEGIRHLPVVDKKGKLIGIVTDRDIREAGPSDATALDPHQKACPMERWSWNRRRLQALSPSP